MEEGTPIHLFLRMVIVEKWDGWETGGRELYGQFMEAPEPHSGHPVSLGTWQPPNDNEYEKQRKVLRARVSLPGRQGNESVSS